jgi:enoyl-[acyl-carrier protein] reductase II
MGFPPNRDASGDLDAMDLLAGQSVGLVRGIKGAADIVHDLVHEATEIIDNRLRAPTSS